MLKHLTQFINQRNVEIRICKLEGKSIYLFYYNLYYYYLMCLRILLEFMKAETQSVETVRKTKLKI